MDEASELIPRAMGKCLLGQAITTDHRLNGVACITPAPPDNMRNRDIMPPQSLSDKRKSTTAFQKARLPVREAPANNNSPDLEVFH
eukprot:scaffold112178_cov23-Tisochrysis_lutea.AAC.1